MASSGPTALSPCLSSAEDPRAGCITVGGVSQGREERQKAASSPSPYGHSSFGADPGCGWSSGQTVVSVVLVDEQQNHRSSIRKASAESPELLG